MQFDTASPAELARHLSKLRASYEAGTPTVSDEAFDRIEDALRKKSPKHAYFKRVGARLKTAKNREVRLPYPMGSLDKVRQESVDNFLSSYAMVGYTPKLDGVSVMLVAGAKSAHLYTRGDGVLGQDVTHLLKPLGLLALLPRIRKVFAKSKRVVMRGELIMPRDTFEVRFAGEFKNARNLVAGLVNANPDTFRVAVAKATHFVVHEVIEPRLYHIPAKTLHELTRGENGLKLYRPNMLVRDRITSASLESLLNATRRRSKYALDGLVLTCWASATKFAREAPTRIAFKGKDTGYLARVGDIEWGESRYGVLKPTVIFEHPVEIDGVNVSRATAHNAGFVMKHQLRVGTSVLITRSGDVIPYIKEVVQVAKKGKLIFPEGFDEGQVVWNDTKVDLVRNVERPSDDQKTAALAHFLDALSVKGVQGALLGPIVAAGIDTPERLVISTASVLGKHGKLGLERARALVDALDHRLRHAQPTLLMVALGVFGKGFGITRAEQVLDAISHDQLLSDSDAVLRRRLEATDVVPSAIEAVMLGRASYASFVRAAGYKVPRGRARVSDRLSGMAFVFTGVRDPDLQTLILDNGGKIESSVTRKVTHLVCADRSSASSKMEKARAQGVKIWTLAEARDRLKGKTPKKAGVKKKGVRRG